MRILVNPDELRTLAVRLKQAALSLEDIYIQVRRAWSGLDWDVKEQAGLETIVIQAQRLAQSLAEQADSLARTLEGRALAFEQADQEESNSLMRTTQAWHATLQAALLQNSGQYRSFPSARSQRYTQLGSLINTQATNRGFALHAVRVEPQEMRAIVNFSVDGVLGKLGPIGMLKDGLDVMNVPAWHASVNQAFEAWNAAVIQHGANSSMARTLYGNYLEVMIFKMPFLGTKAEALLSVMKIVGRINPVE